MHKYIQIYNQCESKFGDDELMTHLTAEDVYGIRLCCVNKTHALIPKSAPRYKELIDFLDGNGFYIGENQYGTTYIITPMVKG